MKRVKHLVRASSLLGLMVLFSTFATPHRARAASTPMSSTFEGYAEQTQQNDDGSIQLSANAAPAPLVYGNFRQFGFVISPAQQLSQPTNVIRLDYTAMTPSDSVVLFDVRASTNGMRWTEWETDLAAQATATFDIPARFVQYRATLLGNDTSPTVQRASITALPSQRLDATYEASAQHFAPTYRVRGTRMGMVGGRTANGHRIKANDIYVSLPSRKSLSSNGGKEYMVRVTANGRSVVAPVYDVGPWNINDNYWDKKRVKYGDLPRGRPEDHAAYYDGYNKGRAEKGRVSHPTAIDIGDGVWRQLGIRGDQGTVDVTFLWLGADPGENADPLKPGEEPKQASVDEPTTEEATPTPTEAAAEPTTPAPADAPADAPVEATPTP